MVKPRQPAVTLAKSAKGRMPCSLQVPKLILRAIHPVAQNALGGAVGQGQAGVEQRPNDRRPNVEHFTAVRAEFIR